MAWLTGRVGELERRFAATRRVEDEVEWLRARVRAGDLQQERLELGAYCGHEAARRLEASEALVAGVSWHEFISGFELGRDWGNVVRVRVGVAIASLSLRKMSIQLRHVLLRITGVASLQGLG